MNRSAGKSSRKEKKSSKDRNGEYASPVKKKISISGGKIVDVEAQAPVDEETELANAQFQSRLKGMLLSLVVVLCVIAPYFLNFQVSAPKYENSEKNLETFLSVAGGGSSNTIGETIMGARIEELIGNQGTPPPNCAIFYSDDPEFNPKALATRICPDRADNHVAFHIKGVFGTHPNNTQFVKGEKAAKVKYVSTGKEVYTHFFDQHTQGSQQYFVAPGNEIDIITLSGTQISKFYENFDTVKVMNAQDTVGFRFKGQQVQYPDCVNYYGKSTMSADVDGFIICHHQRSKYIELRPGEGILDRLWNDVGGRMQPLQYVQVGKRVTTFLDFEKNPGMERITMEAGTTHDLIKESKPGATPGFELRPKFLKVTTTDPNIKGGTSSKRYVAQKLSLDEPAPDPAPEPAAEEEDEEGVMEEAPKPAKSMKSLDDLDPVAGATKSSSEATTTTATATSNADEDEGTGEIFDKRPASSSSSSGSSSSASSASGTKKREVDDDEEER